MPAAAVAAGFQARLLAQWDQNDAVIIEPNTVTEPPSGPHVLIQYPVANGSKPALGRRFFEEGAARLVLNAPVGTGVDTWLALADELADIFRETDVTVSGGGTLKTFAPDPPVVDDNIEEGNWIEVSVVVPYRYQHDG